MTQHIHIAGRQIAPLGVGAWAWGDRSFWGYGGKYGKQEVEAAFVASTEAGITLFDTAEVYGRGESERILGELARKHVAPILTASKFAPLPWRLSPRTLHSALDRSLQRLGVERIDLYQVHWPYLLLPIDALMDSMAEAVKAGKIGAVGVSNYNAQQMRQAHAALQRHGIPLASNQVNYSLLHRTPEVNGVLDACRELDVVLIAYSPLAQGLLTGKYTVYNRPGGPRYITSLSTVRAIEPVIDLLTRIGRDHGNKPPAQVALAWLIGQGNVLPIPGAKNRQQASSNAGALGWSLTADEMDALEHVTRFWRK